jgi:hypothetical protein
MKSVWAIVVCLGVMTILSVAMVFLTSAHFPKASARAFSHKNSPALCNCKGQCMRKESR